MSASSCTAYDMNCKSPVRIQVQQNLESGKVRLNTLDIAEKGRSMPLTEREVHSSKSSLTCFN